MKLNIVTLIVALGLIYLAIRSVHEPWTAMRIAAVILGLPSLVLLILARIELGGAFSVRPKAQAARYPWSLLFHCKRRRFCVSYS